MRKYSFVRAEILRSLQILAEKDLPVNTENLMRYCDDIKHYRQAGGLIRRLRSNDVIGKDYKMKISFLEWLGTKK